MSIRSIAVFAGSSPGAQPAYREAAEAVGRLAAARRLTLVYGGGRVGSMGALADAALEAGGRVVGGIPRRLVEKEVAHKGLTELHVVDTMHERKALMAEQSDAVVALPGGYGTLDELFEALTWTQLGYQRKPCGVLNVAGFFDPLVAMVRHAATERFVTEQHRDMLLVDDEPDRLVDRLAEYTLPCADKWLDREAAR